MADSALKYLNPEVVSSLNNLELIASLVVEGYLTGLHKSPFHGFSVEFSQHRPYMTGDNLRFIDWKVYGKTDRYYIKQYEEETNLSCHILLDISSSMLFGGKSITKAQYASYLSAALSYLMLKQRDATGLILFDYTIQKKIQPKSVLSYHSQILKALSTVRHGKDTNLSETLHQIAEQIKRRGLILLISDLIDDPEKIIAGLKHFRHNNQEVIVFHIIDENEMFFNFSGDTIFEDLESGHTLKTQPQYIKKQYQDYYQNYLNTLKVDMSNNHITYQQLLTTTSFEKALTEYLLKRKKLQ